MRWGKPRVTQGALSKPFVADLAEAVSCTPAREIEASRSASAPDSACDGPSLRRRAASKGRSNPTDVRRTMHRFSPVGTNVGTSKAVPECPEGVRLA